MKIRGAVLCLFSAVVATGWAGAGVPLMQMRLRANDSTDAALWRQTFAAVAENPGCCDEIWFSTGCGVPQLDWHANHVAVLKQAICDVRAAGIVPALQFQATLGHGDSIGSGEAHAAKTWTGWTDWKGVETRTCNCPRQAAFHDYLRQTAALYAKLGFASVWIDDDLRYNNHRPAENDACHVGCWCATCIQAFNARTGASWTRASLGEAVKTDKALAAAWRTFSIDALCDVARTIAEVFHAESPSTMLALQQGSWADAADSVRAILKTLHETSGSPVGYRPGGGAYYDVNPNEQVAKSLQSCYFIGELAKLPDYVVARTPEIESWPRTYYSRSAQSVLVEGFVALAYGMNRMSYFISNSAKEDPRLYAQTFWGPLAKAAPALHGFADILVGARPVGVACRADLSLGLRRAGVPVLAGLGESRGVLTDAEADFEPASVTSRDVQAVRDAVDVRCGMLPAKLCSPFVGLMVPHADAQGRLRAVALVNTRIGAQHEVRIRLRGLTPACTSVRWQELSAPPVSLAVTRTAEGAFVTIPAIGGWNAGYLDCTASGVKVTFVGDALCNGPMLEAYRTGADRYDFTSVFSEVKPLLDASDFVVANLETPLAPDNRDLTHERWSFCSPREFAVALKEAGVDFVFTANNHCLDRGPAGVRRTLETLDAIGLPHTGTFATQAAADEPTIVDVGGIKLGMMSATYGSNAFSNHQYLKDDERFMVNYFQEPELTEPDARAWFANRTSSEGRAYAAREAKRWPDNLTLMVYERIESNAVRRAKIRADVARMKVAKPDFILMGMHAGGQYNPSETKYTRELATFLTDCGIDWLVGSHEHVVHGSDFSGFRNGTLVTYSLGNFDALSGTWIKPFDQMAEWSVAWHVYLTRAANGRAKVAKTTFTVLKTVKGVRANTIRVVPAADLYARATNEAERAELKAGIVEIARRFSGRDISREPVVCEYEAVSGPQPGCVTVDDKLPAGNVIVEKISGDTVSLRQDLRGMRKDERWFYWAFRVRGAAGRTMTFNFTDPYGGGPVGLRGPVVTRDRGKTYDYPLDGKATRNAFTYTFPKDADDVWFYECHPYLQADWDAFLGRHVAARGRTFETGELCRSKKGRAVEKGVFGCLKDPKHTVLVSSRHHASESVATFVLEGFLEAVLANDELGAWYQANTAVMAVPFMDKDGCEQGEQGKNRAPHDHNRDYTTFIYPETKATTAWIQSFAANRLDVWLDFHCPWIRGQYNEFVYSPLKRDVNGRNAAAEARFDAWLEEMQTGSLAYKASDDLPYGQAWNKGGNYTAGWSCINWAINKLPAIKLGHTFEIPFASANGRVVTPEKCRELGRDIARVTRRFLTTPAN